jgi:ATP-dependent Lon protease
MSSEQKTTQTLPAALPVLPMKNAVLFPHLLMPLAVGRPASLAAVEAALASEDKTLLLATQNNAATDEPGKEDLFSFGTVAVIKKAERGEGVVHLFVQGLQRVRLGEVQQTTPFLRISAEPAPVENEATTEVEALDRELLDLTAGISELLEDQTPVALIQIVSQVGDALQRVYLLASLLGVETEKARQLLAASSYAQALRLGLEIFTHERHVLEVRSNIASQAHSEMSREQREYILRQQMRAIQDELGGAGGEQAEAGELRRKLEEAGLPEYVRKEAEAALRRLERMSSQAADYQLARAHLELILELPWNQATTDNLELPHARTILDEDHFDLKEVKDRIIEHLAVMKLNPAARAPILCFVGPPGVGKTSLGQSIARALERKFERLALGGLHDEAELRGHRRTYVGSMPGRLIQAIRRAEVNNPLLMLDEVDKLGRDFRGDPAAALMEILDPAQNHQFHDNYLDIPFDLSKVFFICTANTLDTIPRPLLDRMEILRLSGYSDEEKRQIARRYLLPRQLQLVRPQARFLQLPDESLRYIIRRYTREAGVRELERVLGRIARKAAMKFVEGRDEPLTVHADDLSESLGPEKFFPERLRQKLAPGVAAGLAWTEAGGEVLYVETVRLPDSRELLLTGQLGSVMQESAKAARSFLLSQSAELGIEPQRIENAGVHLHVPAGSIPKDGPSAGVTIVTALASLYAQCPVRSDTAMTGEITLSGLVMPVGGIKEKVLAAHRAGISRVILPQENEKDLQELPEHVRQAMEFIPARHIEDVLRAAIPQMADQLQASAV